MFFFSYPLESYYKERPVTGRKFQWCHLRIHISGSCLTFLQILSLQCSLPTYIIWTGEMKGAMESCRDPLSFLKLRYQAHQRELDHHRLMIIYMIVKDFFFEILDGQSYMMFCACFSNCMIRMEFNNGKLKCFKEEIGYLFPNADVQTGFIWCSWFVERCMCAQL